MSGLDLGSAGGTLVLLVAGLAAGFINTLAGGGSMLTLPALMLLGMPVDVANGTNRLAVFAQCIAAVLGFDASGKLDRASVLRVALPTLFGAAGGAVLASFLSAKVLEPVFVVCLLAVAPTLLGKPRLVLGEGEAPRGGVLGVLGLFLIGVYGGFIQAGVGIFLLAFLGRVLGYDLVRGNALKVAVVAAFTAVALAIFVARGQVVLLPGAVLGVGTVVGARLAVRVSLGAHEVTLRRIVFVLVVGACLGLLLR
jgi:uncharacterized membrane protein YfcA